MNPLHNIKSWFVPKSPDNDDKGDDLINPIDLNNGPAQSLNRVASPNGPALVDSLPSTTPSPEPEPKPEPKAKPKPCKPLNRTAKSLGKSSRNSKISQKYRRQLNKAERQRRQKGRPVKLWKK